MASGVSVKDECVDLYNDLKLKHTLSYVIFKISDDEKNIEIEQKGEKGASFDQFKEALAGSAGEKDPRYAIYDCCYQAKEGNREKIIFIVWCPDTAKIKKKMLLASSKDALKKKLVGCGVEVQACDLSDLNLEELAAKCEKYNK